MRDIDFDYFSWFTTGEVEDTLERTQFSPARKDPAGGKRWLAVGAIVAGVLILGGAGAYFFLGKGGGIGGGEPTPTPTPFTQPKSTPTSMPTPSAEKDEVSIKILNGTGIEGEAGKLTGILKEMGYSQVEAGNASKTDYETAEASFASDFPEQYREEILDKLESTFKAVKETSSDTGKVDAVIITGLRPGQSLPEEDEVTPTPTEGETTGTPTPTGSPTPTSTSALTPAP